eukprot:1143037-Pelagomonas_calceolata.AAC.8
MMGVALALPEGEGATTGGGISEGTCVPASGAPEVGGVVDPRDSPDVMGAGGVLLEVGWEAKGV